MEPNSGATGGTPRLETQGAQLDPQVMDFLRSALARGPQEQESSNGVSGAELPNEETKERKRRKWLPPWNVLLAALVVGTAVTGVLIYVHLSAIGGQLRSEIGKMRREVGALRSRGIRRDDFSSRNLAVATTVKDIQSSNHVALDNWTDRFQEQVAFLNELRLQIKELQRDAERLRQRLPQETTRDAVSPRPAGGSRKSGS